MPYPSPIVLERSLKQAQFDSLGLTPEERYVVWCGAIKSNLRPNWVPRIVVWFRLLRPDGSLGDFRGWEVVMTALRQFRIVSVWQNRRSVAQVKLERRRMQLKYSDSCWTQARSCADHRARGRLSAAGREGHLFEAERKLVTSRDKKAAGAKVKEQNYCGLAVFAPAQRSQQDWVTAVLFQIAESRGIMRNVLTSLPWLEGSDYRRTKSWIDAIAGQSTAANALSKLGVELPKIAE